MPVPSSITMTWRRSGSRGRTASTSGRELRLDDDGDGVAVVEEVDELVLHVAVVHVDRDGSQLVGREHRLHELDAVVRVDRHVVAATDALRGEVVGQAVGALLELREGLLAIAADQGGAIGHGIDRVLDEVGQVEGHAAVEHVLSGAATGRWKGGQTDRWRLKVECVLLRR